MFEIPDLIHCLVGHDIDEFYRLTENCNDELDIKVCDVIVNPQFGFKKEQHCERTVHAEINAIANAAKLGVSINGAAMYCTMFPCYNCAKLITVSGISHIIAENEYQSSDRSKKLFDYCGINYVILNKGFLYE